MAVFDFVMTIVNLIMFIRPLRMLLRDVHKMEKKKSIATERLISTARKFTILTAITTISTCIFLVGLIATDIESLAGVDMILNTVCMLLFTPYYPDKHYYFKWCKCCIKCCDAGNYSAILAEVKPIERSVVDKANRNGELEPTATVANGGGNEETASSENEEP